MALLSTTMYSQSIICTLAPGGSAIINDGSTTFFSLSQNNGKITLSNGIDLPPTYAGEVGVIYKAGDRFIHDYQGSGTQGGNTFVGIESGNFTMGGSSVDQGSLNSGFGATTLRSLTKGNRNAAFGVSALQDNTEGAQNSAFGANTLFSNTTGNNNSAFGQGSLPGSTTGYNNSAFGEEAGNNVTTGSNLTLIGFNAQPSAGSASNEMTLGNGGVGTLRCAAATITTLSDARDKKNIQDLQLGIDFLMKIKPRQFNWDKREWYENKVSDGTKMQHKPTAGFIAQELDKVQISENAEWLNLVLKENPNRLEATPGNLLPIVVKAIQELKEENDTIKKENEKLAKENLKLQKDIAAISSSISEKVREEVKAVLLKAAGSGDSAEKVSMNIK